ncbi:alpha/beta hydrolase fold domain-containing protein [Robertmurraya sp. GLU-23]
MSYRVRVVPDLVFSSPKGKPLLLDLYLPQHAEEPFPVIVWIHGGGWRIGDRKLGPDCCQFFAEKGFVMASIEYRLSGEALFPAQIHDVKAAIRWLRSVADKYHLDSENIGLWGSSAGGHLAALAGTTGSGVLEELEHGCADFSCNVQAVVDGYGPTDFLQMDLHHTSEMPSNDPETDRLHPTRHHSDMNSPESQLLGAPIHLVPDRVREANPITYIKGGEPPFLIMHGTNDTAVPAHQSELLYQALLEKGNDATLCLIDGFGHAFFNNNDLDKHEPYSARLRTTRAGEKELTETTHVKIFEMIERFFEKHLMKMD